MGGTLPTCPFCAWPEAAPGPLLADGTAYLRCRRCGSGFIADPGLDFRALYEGHAPPLVEALPDVLVRRYAAMLDRLEQVAPSRSLLEVGCGNGHFLRVAEGRGWEVHGVELSRAHTARAREAGLDVAHGDLVADGLFEGRSFGAVVMIEVIEHIPRPRALLAACAQRLARGGVLFLTTPNFNSVTRRLLGPRWGVLSYEHVCLATPAGLRRALGETGFAVRGLRTKGLYLGEYRKLWRGEAEGGPSMEQQNVVLRDRIEASPWLSAAKGAVNGVLAVTGSGEGMECLAVAEGVGDRESGLHP